MEVIPIALEHAEGFHRSLDVVARERKYLAQTKALPLEEIRSFVQHSVEIDAPQFVVIDGDTVAGWADILPHRMPTLAHRGGLGMGLLPEYRGKGLGEKLLVACLDKAKEKGITRVELEVRADNLPAINLYKKLGFETETIKRNAMCFEGEYFDTVQMSLLLD